MAYSLRTILVADPVLITLPLSESHEDVLQGLLLLADLVHPDALADQEGDDVGRVLLAQARDAQEPVLVRGRCTPSG